MQGGKDVWTRDVLNLGLKPSMLIERVAKRFAAAGGTILDSTPATGVTIHPNGAAIALADTGPSTSTGKSQ